MFDLLTLKNIEDYFEVQSKRNKIGVYFYRIIGYNDEFLKFFRKYQTYAQRKGTYISKTIKNPDITDVQYLNTIIKSDFELDINCIKRECTIWLKFLNENQVNLISESIYEVLGEMKKSGTNINILKNTYIKFLYWIKYRFENSVKYIGMDEVPKILYEGDIGKSELYMLRVLSLAGCDVIYLNFISEESYMKIDNQSKYSMRIVKEIRKIPPVHFSKINLNEIQEKEKILRELNNINIKMNTNDWLKEDFLEELYKDNNSRSNNSLEINNMFIKYIGIDNKDEYNNRLYKLKTNLEKSNKKVMFLEKSIENPTMDEISHVRFNYKSKEDIVFEIIKRINISSNEEINKITKRELAKIINAYQVNNLAQVYNVGVKLLCWIERYGKKLFSIYNSNNIPVLVYYGKCSSLEMTFLCIMSKLPIDIIYITPNKNNIREINQPYISDNSKIVELPNSVDEFEFPKNEIKIRASTVAYNAEKELNQILYNDTGMYRNKQFKTCESITLKTTYEEISILWKEIAKYRPNFKVEDNKVIVPNIFAKVCGVKNNDINEYLKNIQEMITEKTIMIKGLPYIKKDTQNVFYAQVHKFVNNGKINVEEIKKCKDYKYNFLNTNTQEYILSKIQEMINLKLILPNDNSINQKIVSTLLNLDKNILRIIQQFDFTKEIPKVIIMDFDENIATWQDCIILLFFNLLGFDIIIYTPTGYQNIEKYINTNLYEEYQIGDYIYNIELPNFKVANRKKQKSFKDFFKRRN